MATLLTADALAIPLNMGEKNADAPLSGATSNSIFSFLHPKKRANPMAEPIAYRLNSAYRSFAMVKGAIDDLNIIVEDSLRSWR